MTTQQDTLWDLIEDIELCMVTTQDGAHLRSRPMAAKINEDARTIHFLTDPASGKTIEIAKDRQVNLAFADTDDHAYASISGRATVSTDRVLIKSLWDDGTAMWFEGDADTADVAVITIHPEQAEYWCVDKGKLQLAYEFAKAYFTDDTPDIGVNVKLNKVA